MSISLLGGAALGAVITAIVGGIPLENYRRHRDRNSTAVILAAEIDALLLITERDCIVEQFEAILRVLDAGKDIETPRMYVEVPQFGPIFETHIEKLGLLSPDLSGRLVRFYHLLIGVRASLHNFVETSWPAGAEGTKMKAANLRAGIAMWLDAEKLGKPLVADLRAAPSRWWPICLISLTQTKSPAG